jgi:hypothetical protein
MPNVTGPLMSISASGTISDSVNYRHTKRGTVARVHSKPSGQPSLSQLSIRAITKQVAQSWSSVNTIDRATWNILAEANSYSAFNAFFVINFERVSTGQAITTVWPPLPPSPPPDLLSIVFETPISPDLSGDYFEDVEINGLPSYKRTSPGLAFIWSSGGQYFCSPDYTENWDCYFEGPPGSPTGYYSGAFPAYGTLLVSLP